MIFVYDGTFAGLLSVLFTVYERREEVTDIVPEDRFQPPLFGEVLEVETDAARAARVRSGLIRRSGNAGVAKICYRAFLTERPEVERLIYHYARRQLAVENADISKDAGDEKIRQLLRLDQQMGREVHRMHAFVRFQETPDGMYVALVNPDFNCLPLIGDHFAARYPAMEWLIYDTKRHYGLHWNAQTKRAEFITLTQQHDGRLRHLGEELLATAETDYRDLWRVYFNAVDIPERRNLKLHLQHVPRRYWKYLTEK